MVCLTIPLYPKYRIRIKKKKFVQLLLHLAYLESAPRFSTTYEDFKGSIFQPCQLASYIRALRDQNAIKIFSLPNRKFSLWVFFICAKWVKSCPDSVHISTTWKKLRSFLSVLDRMQWAKKPSHATVPALRAKKLEQWKVPATVWSKLSFEIKNITVFSRFTLFLREQGILFSREVAWLFAWRNIARCEISFSGIVKVGPPVHNYEHEAGSYGDGFT